MILQTVADVTCSRCKGQFRLAVWDGFDYLLCNYNCVAVLQEESSVTSYSWTA